MTVMERSGPIFHEKSGCVSCHNNSLPQAALNIALRRGIAVHPEAASHAAPATLGEFRSRVPDLMLSSCAGPAFLSLATKGLHGFRDEGIEPNFVTYAVTSCLAGLQQPDGGWGNDGIGLRPPLSFTPIDATALAIAALDRYSAPGLRDEMQARSAAGWSSYGPRRLTTRKMRLSSCSGSSGRVRRSPRFLDRRIACSLCSTLTAAGASCPKWRRTPTRPVKRCTP
jgi:hypothetical protein